MQKPTEHREIGVYIPRKGEKRLLWEEKIGLFLGKTNRLLGKQVGSTTVCDKAHLCKFPVS